MRILHYSLGFPPYRTGGLTKFSMDLMKQQELDGNEVSLLWPGKISFAGNKTRIKKHASVEGISSYEIINPLPVSYDEGISDCHAFMVSGTEKSYEDFLAKIRPDVIHVHTLMGLHKALLEEAKKAKIRIVFTTHDFFPICPKVTMFRHGKVCDSFGSCKACGSCNGSALSINKIRILQSPLYRLLKDSKVVRIVRKKHRDKFLMDKSVIDDNISRETAENYLKLRKHYMDMLELADIIHFNSNVTKNTYELIHKFKNSVVINITHADINDYRKRKFFCEDVIRIRYLGPQGEAKGYYLLIHTLDKLWKEKQNFRLDVHFATRYKAPYIIEHERYSYNQLASIFDETDVLIAPSIWNETFGYTVLEALSFGVPVIISGTVGAKDIISDDAGIIIDDIDSDKLLAVLRELTVDKLDFMNRSICDHQHIQTITELSKSILKDLYIEKSFSV